MFIKLVELQLRTEIVFLKARLPLKVRAY